MTWRCVYCTRLADWLPTVQLPFGDSHSEAIGQLPLCDGHRRRATAHDVLTDEVWAGFVGAYTALGAEVPPRDSATLGFIPITSPAAQTFLARLAAERSARVSWRVH